MNMNSRTILGSLAITLVGSGLLAITLFFVAWASGSTTGIEFSPDDFSRRKFSYVRPSWLPITLQGLVYQNVSDPLILWLVNKGYVTPTTGRAQKWDLVWDSRMPPDSTAYDAQILCAYLDLQDLHGTNVFLQWSQKYPDHAKILWPQVARCARAGRYTEIPQLFDFVLRQPEPIPLDDFDRRVKKLVSGMTLPPEELP